MQTTGSYKSKKTGQEVAYTYDFEVLSISVISDLDEVLDGAGKLCQRMLKVDANNLAREKAKTANGDSTRKALTEQEKAESKAKRQADADLLRRVKEAIANGTIEL